MAAEQLIFELAPDATPSFANFLPGANVEAVAHLRALAAGQLRETSVAVWGVAGSGKSHLVRAVVDAASMPARRLDLDADGVPEVAGEALFAVEGVDRLGDIAQGRLFTLYNTCREQGAHLLLASSVPPQQAPLRDDLRTRIGWGLVLEVKPLADADKPAALAAYANEQGFRLPPEVISFLLSHVRRDMGNLLSIVRALGRHSLATKRPVTVPLARDLLQPGIAFDARPHGAGGT
jgi:DnaA family protein